MTQILQQSQMWEGFLVEREIWKKKQILDSCVLIKEANSVWCVEDLSLTCCKCKKRFSENGHTKNGRFYCQTCFELKFSILLEQRSMFHSKPKNLTFTKSPLFRINRIIFFGNEKSWKVIFQTCTKCCK